MCVCVCETMYMSSPCSLFLGARHVLELGLFPLATPLSPHNVEGQRASAAASAAQINQTFSWAEAIAWWAEGRGCGGVWGGEYERQESKVTALHV